MSRARNYHLKADSLFERLSRLFDQGGADNCWEWRGSRAHGYGRIVYKRRGYSAHRAVYEHLVGPIPDGLVIDHKCRNHGCVNPKHMEPVTNKVNVLRGTGPTAVNARKTHCKRGHPLSGVNLYREPCGYRQCRTCRSERHQRRVRRRRALKLQGGTP